MIGKLEMDRVAFTIIQNGLHHLKHNDYYKFILDNFSYWVVIEGASGNNGSTTWCNSFPSDLHNNGKSIDGTNEFLIDLSKKYKNIIHISPSGIWNSKDDQINAGIRKIKEITNKCFLWEIDVDEQWNINQIEYAEKMLLKSNAKTGCFLCDYYVGKDLIAIGEWGEGLLLPYRRLWNWSGELFETHEPPRLKGGNGVGILVHTKFKHYAMFFEKDVKFKDKWYGGHNGIYERWLELQKEKMFPQHINKLLGENMRWAKTNTKIVRI
jgi:hypothetical protein